MADTGSHRLDLRVGGKYRLGKKIGSGSFGASTVRLIGPDTYCIPSRRYLPRYQHHFGGRSRHQA